MPANEHGRAGREAADQPQVWIPNESHRRYPGHRRDSTHTCASRTHGRAAREACDQAGQDRRGAPSHRRQASIPFRPTKEHHYLIASFRASTVPRASDTSATSALFERGIGCVERTRRRLLRSRNRPDGRYVSLPRENTSPILSLVHFRHLGHDHFSHQTAPLLPGRPSHHLRTTTLIDLKTSLGRVKPCADGSAQGRHRMIILRRS